MATIRATSAIPTYQGIDPTYISAYIWAIHDQPATVAAKNFLSLFNPSGSGRSLIVLGVTVADYSVNSVTAATSMEVWRTTAASGGTQITGPNVNRFLTAAPDPLAEVRINNPTVTLAGADALIGFPPSLGSGAQSPNTVSPTPGASFVILPGQGVVFVQNAGDVDERWNLQIVWAEVRN